MSKEIENNYKDSFNDRKNIPVGKRTDCIALAIEKAITELGSLPVGREGMLYLWRRDQY